jgi:hypothetical protein
MTDIRYLDRHTLGEKFVSLLHLPFMLGCFVWTIALLATPLIVSGYLIIDSHTGQNEFEKYGIRLILYIISLSLLAFYLPMSIRYLRNKLINLEPNISSILKNGEPAFYLAFGLSSSYRGQIIMLSLSSIVPIMLTIYAGTLIRKISNFAGSSFIVINLSSLVWFCLACCIGLYKLAGDSFEFKPALQDSRLGTRPIGSLCLAMSGAYFLGMILLIWMQAVSPYDIGRTAVLYAFDVFLIIIGIAMFFLPLMRIHQKMVEEKNKQELLIQEQLVTAFDNTGSDSPAVQLEKVQKTLALVMAETKLSSISTWPFDTRTIGQFLVFLLSVIASLIAAILWPYLLPYLLPYLPK